MYADSYLNFSFLDGEEDTTLTPSPTPTGPTMIRVIDLTGDGPWYHHPYSPYYIDLTEEQEREQHYIRHLGEAEDKERWTPTKRVSRTDLLDPSELGALIGLTQLSRKRMLDRAGDRHVVPCTPTRKHPYAASIPRGPIKYRKKKSFARTPAGNNSVPTNREIKRNWRSNL